MPLLVKPTDVQQREMEELLNHLYRIRDELMLVDPRSLSLTLHKKWNEEIYQTGLAISAVQKSILSGITQAFASDLVSIENATRNLASSLYSLKKANQVIQAISGVLNVITSIVKLLP